MMRLVGTIILVLAAVWVVAHLLYLGPIEAAAEVTIAWIVSIAAVSAVVAALTVLAAGLVLGPSRPAWLRFVQMARSGATMVGAALVVVGLLHYRDTEPRGEIHWIVLGVIVLAGAGAVHWWVLRTRRKELT